MARKTITINRFDGGMVNDPRDPRGNTCSVVTNFDVLTNAYRMTPYRTAESGDSAASTSQKQNFAVALRTGSTYSLYALGVVSGTGKAEVLYKNLTTGAATDLDDSGWATPGNNQSSAGTTNMELFVYYKKTGLIYGARAGTHIWTYSPSGSAWDDTARAITYSTVAQGVVHPKTDILYIPYDNKIATNNNGTWTDAALTLPSHFYITSITPHGNFLAIACAPLVSSGESRVFLWDMTSSDVADNALFGEGSIKVLATAGSDLVGIALSTSSLRHKDRITIKRYTGYGFETIQEFVGGDNTTQLPLAKQGINDRIYFMMRITLDGNVLDGVWSVGKKDSGYSVVHERTPNNSDALTSGASLKNFVFVGDFLFQSYVDTNYALMKTLATATYSATSSYETLKLNGGDAARRKQLIGVTVNTVSTPASATVTLSYKVDAESSYTTIGTITATGTISKEFVTVVSTGKNFPEFNEIQFKLTSVGGSEITGLKCVYEEKKTLLELK